MTKRMPSTDAKRKTQISNVHVAARRSADPTPEARARMALRPTVQAALTLMEYSKDFGELSITTLVDDLGRQCERTSGGDLSQAESILTAQAQALDAIFHSLARKAKRAERLDQLDTHLRLALKAQAQCRATLEALVAIKNPQPVAFVRQANIANGPQQVNNGANASRQENSQIEQNELLEHSDGQRLDTRAARTPGRANSALEAMGAVDRSKDAGR